MSFHRNAKLGLGGRCALVGAIEGGLPGLRGRRLRDPRLVWSLIG